MRLKTVKSKDLTINQQALIRGLLKKLVVGVGHGDAETRRRGDGDEMGAIEALSVSLERCGFFAKESRRKE